MLAAMRSIKRSLPETVTHARAGPCVQEQAHHPHMAATACKPQGGSSRFVWGVYDGSGFHQSCRRIERSVRVEALSRQEERSRPSIGLGLGVRPGLEENTHDVGVWD